MKSSYPQTSTTRPSKAARRGFTLVELMAAMTGGLMITVAVYAFTRDVTAYFQNQMRLSDATTNAITGFQRLQADIARAGFLSSPNLARDPMSCPAATSGGVAVAPTQFSNQLVNYPGIEDMGLLQISQGETILEAGIAGNFMLANNAGGIDPDKITLYGNYTTAEHFPVKFVNIAAGIIHLDLNSAAMGRIGIPGSNDLAALSAAFPTGRILRLVDESGRQQFGIIAGVSLSIDSEGDPTITLNPGVSFVAKATNGLCGLRAHVTGAVVNTVNIVRYELQNISTNTSYARLFDADLAAPAYENTRLDLMRVELDPEFQAPFTGDVPQLIAEYAVDLQFGLTVQDDMINGTNVYLPEDSGALLDYADVPHNTATSGKAGPYGPHLIRGVHARLAVRTRLADYQSPLLTNLTGVTSADLHRVAVATGEYARLRSLQAHIATRNTRTETWQ